MKFYYVYFLRCSDKSIYVGVTSDVERRVMEHNCGKHKKAYTYDKRPVTLVYYQEFIDPNQAIEFEKKLKNWSRIKKEALINEDFDKLQSLSECRNATHFKYDPAKNEEDIN